MQDINTQPATSALDPLSRLKGIETKNVKIHIEYILTLDPLSRLKGMFLVVSRQSSVVSYKRC